MARAKRWRGLAWVDRITAGLLTFLIVGSALAFGGAVWWAKPAIALLTILIVLGVLARIALEGTWKLLKSPLGLLACSALALGVVQLVPLPAALAGRISPRSRAIHEMGAPVDLVRADDPSSLLTNGVSSRTPVTLDRSATFRWLLGGLACLAIFWSTSQFADRLGHLQVIWGSVLLAFFVNTVLTATQLFGNAPGLYGSIRPGAGPSWLVSKADVLEAPGAFRLDVLQDPQTRTAAWAVEVPHSEPLLGSLLGGPGAYLALASLALPLAVGVTLQVLAPRGSRDGFGARLAQGSTGSLAAILLVLTLGGAVLVGALAGPWLCGPFALGLLLAALPGARAAGVRWSATALTFAGLTALGSGIALGRALDVPSALPGEDVRGYAAAWRDAARAWSDFPLLGVGLGSTPSVLPYYKSADLTSSTARSSLLQWGLEAGLVGLALAGLGLLWCLVRLPRAVRAVGTADRCLAYAWVGAVVGFVTFSLLHWTVELPAVALAASALGGTGHRWLAGGTDLFVARA